MDAISVDRSGRPPLPFLTFILLPDVALAAVMALRPPPIIRFAASLILITTIMYAAMTYTVGRTEDDYTIGSAVLGIMVLNVMLFTWPLDAAKDIQYLKYPGPLAEKPLWMRFWHSLCMLRNYRLIGTNAQVANVPPPYKGTRTRYLIRRVCQLLFTLAMLDVIEAFVFTHKELYDPSRNDAHFPPGLKGYLARSACMALWLLTSYSVVKAGYLVMAIMAVGTHLSNPEDWPELFGKLSDAYTVRRLWGRTWHQLLRRHMAGWANFVVDTLRIPRGTVLSSQVQVHVAFTVSGLLHCTGDLVLGKEYFGHSWKFFAANGVAITFESIVIGLAQRAGIRRTTWATRAVGYVWVCLWLTRSVRLFQEWMYRAGVGHEPLFPFSTTNEIVVPFVRKITGF
ncbi:membrane bound O-acyl transferase family-domain-containing protein [Lenzites betulinus]|nr:membrane bound O-acyl transferase family-domain-containing protein [Lenzites betulinus]